MSNPQTKRTAPQWVEDWPGGRVRLARGRKVWVIERRVGGGARRAVTLHVRSEPEALAELALFERDPLGYKTRQEAATERIRGRADAFALDADSLKEFLAHADARVKKGDLTDQYVKQILGPYLNQWAKALHGRDLRKVELQDLRLALKGKTAQHKRVVALKAFTAWAREEGTAAGQRLKRAEDPTLDLKTPEVIPAKSAKPKGYPIKLVEKLYGELVSQVARDTICLRVKTGMHDTEIDRVARGGGELRRIDDPSGIAGTVVFAHLKKGKMHVVSLDAQGFAAAERLQARGAGVSRNALKLMLDRVAIRWHGCNGVTTKRINKKGVAVWETRPCEKCALIHPGELRHSFATWATTVGVEVHPANQKGVDLAKVAEAMGHLGKKTTSAFYVGDRVPMMIAVPVKLAHPKDPVPLVRKAEGTQAG